MKKTDFRIIENAYGTFYIQKAKQEVVKQRIDNVWDNFFGVSNYEYITKYSWEYIDEVGNYVNEKHGYPCEFKSKEDAEKLIEKIISKSNIHYLS